jgi:sec-independent protein translocase protein TatB
MFDFAWSEIAVIAGVALVLIGPKDLPVAIRTITDMIKKARRMAAEFQTHVDEMMREANLDEVRSSINEIRNFDFKAEVERAVDQDGSLRSTFAENPFEPAPSPEPAPEPAPEAPAAIAEAPAAAVEEPALPQAPAFLPPNAVPPAMAVPVAEAAEPPAFVPPEMAAALRARNL